MSSYQLGALIGLLLSAVLSASIASRKGRSGVGFFVLGGLTGLIGIIIAIAASPRRDLMGFAALSPYRPARAHPGWYQDPQDAHVLRWHDGNNWTQQAYDTRPAPAERSRGSRHRGHARH